MPSLPIVNTNPEVDHDQSKLIENLAQFFKTQNPPAKLPFNTHEGLCSGLVAYWLYYKRIGEEGKFIHRLEHVLTHSEPDDPIIAEFANTVHFLQHDVLLRNDATSRENVTQANLQDSFDLIKAENYPGVTPVEFQIDFVFDLAKLSELLANPAFNGKMIRVSNGMHVIGVMVDDDGYYVYNPDSSQGPQKFSNSSDVAKEIFNGLAKYCESKDTIALSLQSFDINEPTVNKTASAYPDPIQYCTELLADKNYKAKVLAHNNIFHSAMRYRNFKALDLLFANGYKYIPWELSNRTELEEAMMFNDREKFDYLIKHDIPINYRTPNGTTPLGRAVILNRADLILELINRGADIDLAATKTDSLLNIALLFEQHEAVIMLLALGVKVSDREMRELQRKFNPQQMKVIAAHALQLHAKLAQKAHKADFRLLRTLDDVVLQITQKPFSAHSQKDLAEIETILNTLDDILLSDSDVQSRVLEAKSKILHYLETNAYQRKNLFFSTSKTTTLDYERDIRPLLSLSL